MQANALFASDSRNLRTYASLRDINPNLRAIGANMRRIARNAGKRLICEAIAGICGLRPLLDVAPDARAGELLNAGVNRFLHPRAVRSK